MFVKRVEPAVKVTWTLWQVKDAVGEKEETELEHFLCKYKKEKHGIVSVSKGKQV